MTPPAARPENGAVRFSQCNLWREQRRFYQEEGVRAWSGKIPYQATCNPVIANAYAQLIARFLQDYVRSARQSPGPVFLLELGSGPGTFGFYFVKRLLGLLESLELREPGFVYVMSDFCEKNVAFWRSHPALRELVSQGVLDFAQYDVGASRRVRLLESGRVLDRESARERSGAPWVVFANYVFDILPQDVFRVAGGRLFEGRTRGLPEGASLPALDNAPMSLGQLGIGLELQEIRLPYYRDAALDGVLRRYAGTLADQSFLFPLHALLGLRNLIELAGGNLLLVATDKAHGHAPPEVSVDTPDLALHDASFSMMVNFHAIGEYFQLRGGSAVHQPVMQPINTSVFHLGKPFGRLAETQAAVATFLHQFGPGDLNTLFSGLNLLVSSSPPEMLLALLNVGRWDPMLVNAHLGQLVALAKEAGPETRRSLADGLRQCADQFYYLPGAESTLANVGIVFQELRDHASALSCYQRSLGWFGQEPAELYANTLYNMGLCHFYQGEREKALEAFRRSDAAAPRQDMLAKGWIYHLTMECPAGMVKGE
ncbi:MAG TPA: tetratricopeptide repeat protein [Thermoanaerobaculia bacterium]|nr:tetratricopeptide repeat protein [Thermoanaerobaculia bacterium]